MYKNLVRVLKLAANYKLLLTLLFVAVAAVSFCLIAIGGQVKTLIDHGITLANPQMVNSTSINIILLLCCFGVASFIRAMSTNILAGHIITELRSAALSNLLRLQMLFYQEHTPATLQTKIIDSTEAVRYILKELCSFLLRNIIVMLSAIILMCRQSYLLFAMSVSVSIVATLPLAFLLTQGKKTIQNEHSLSQTLINIFSQTISNIKLIYNYNLQEFSKATIAKINEQCNAARQANDLRRAILFSTIASTIAICITLVIWFGSRQTVYHQITSGALVAFIVYALMAVSSLIAIFNNLAEIKPNLEKLNGTFEIIDHTLCEQNIFTINTLPKELDIELENIYFSYACRPDVTVLENLSCKIPFAKFVAICGKSGIGKSTIISLLLKFYEPQKGIIRVGGSDLSQINTELIRQNIVLINQDPLIFNASMLENITLNSAFSKQKLEEVLAICQLEELLKTLPQGINTEVGQNGDKISGGQKQRICIARGLLRSPKLLILDEATCALDETTASLVLQNVKSYMCGKTIVCISHNTFITKYADVVHNLSGD